jgi:hypothetical protein
MAIAVSRPRIAGFRQRLSKEMRGRPDSGRRRSLTVQRPLPDGALMIVARGDRTGDPPAQPFPEPRGASPRPPLLRLPPQMLTEF